MNKYSIILPVKNGGAYLKECVSSILSQTYTSFNLIILENGSTDGTVEWLQTITDERVSILPAEAPLSIAENWSRIQFVKKNAFATIIGHDDILLPHYLEEVNKLIAAHPNASLYQSHFNFIDANGEKIRCCLPMDETQQPHELLASLMAKTIDSMGSGYMFRSHDYDSLHGISSAYPDLLFADNELWINLTTIGYKATTLSNCFSYRLHQSLSRTTAGMNYYQSFTQYISFLQKLLLQDDKMRLVINRYGKNMLTELCEAVAHRLLKTPVDNRNISIKEFIVQCRQYALQLFPGEHFEPTKKTIFAERLDENGMLRTVFQAFRKRYKGKL